jgi:hypothetical protein
MIHLEPVVRGIRGRARRGRVMEVNDLAVIAAVAVSRSGPVRRGAHERGGEEDDLDGREPL